MAKKRARVRKFRVYQVPRGHWESTQRRAIFDALLEADQPWKETKTDMSYLVPRLVNERRLKLYDLQAAGMEFGSNFTWHLNCPPFAVITGHKVKVCRHRFCPFCWARKVGDIHDRVTTYFYSGMNDSDDHPDHDLALVSGVYERVEPIGTPLEHILFAARNTKGEFQSYLDFAGATAVTTISPTAGGWLLSNRFLAAVPRRKFSPVVSADGGEYDVQLHASPPLLVYRRNIDDAVARVCRYPVGWLRGSSTDLVALEAAMSGSRLTANYGVFRNAVLTQRRSEE